MPLKNSVFQGHLVSSIELPGFKFESTGLRLARDWQMDGKGASLPHLALNLDFAVMALYDAVGHSQTQANPLGLGGEKGCEQLVQVLRSNTDPGILNAYLDLPILAQRSADGELSAVRHCLDGIDHQVYEHLLDLTGICHDGWQRWGFLPCDFNMVHLRLVPYQGHNLVNDAARCYRAQHRLRLAREIQKPPHQPGAVADSGVDLGQIGERLSFVEGSLPIFFDSSLV